MKKYYLVNSKSDDYNRYNSAVYYGEIKDIEDYAYDYEEIPKTHYDILQNYFEDLNETDYEDFGYASLGEYLEEYF